MENKPYVSHETIYEIIREDKKEGGTLYKHTSYFILHTSYKVQVTSTRHQLKYRKRPVGKKKSIKNRVSIDQRPKIVDTKEQFGDWEACAERSGV